ncbi:MAG: RNA ligase family protein [Nitrospiraceae bacterium]
MSEFKRYLEVEALHKEEVEGILLGEVWVFPKLDGTNSSVWLDAEGKLQAGSRNRHLSTDKDNAGFNQAVLSVPLYDQLYHVLCQLGPGARLFGEWLVPHTLKTYRVEAWRRFYVFDAANEQGYMHFNDYAQICRDAGLDLIEPLAIVTNPTVEQLEWFLPKNTYMIEQGAGAGEGVVLKNYGFKNKWGRQAYGKIVRNEFREQFHKVMGPALIDGQKQIELEIVSLFVTRGRINKIVAKIGEVEKGKLIPQLLNRTYHEIVTEELWDILKSYKNPTIDFKLLNRAVTSKVKEVAPEIF